MDQAASPCQDMYQLACGRWAQEVVPPPGETRWSMFDILAQSNDAKLRQLAEQDGSLFRGRNSSSVEKWKKFYKSCMDLDALEAQGTAKLKQLMSELGHWSVSPPTDGSAGWSDGDWSLQESLVKNHKLLATSLFLFSVEKDPTVEENKHVIEFFQSGLTLRYASAYDSDQRELKEGFIKYAVRVGTLLGGEENDVTAKMEDVFQFERNLSKIFAHSPDMSSLDSNKYNLTQFDDLMGNWINIKDYLDDIFGGRHYFEHSTEVIVATPSYFSKLGDVVGSARKETLANYLMWRVLHSVVSFLPLEFQLASLELSRVMDGSSVLTDRWRFCVEQAREAVGFAGSALFVDKHFDQDRKAKMTEALENIRLEFIGLLDHVTWLDQSTRSRLKDKARAMSLRIGYPDMIMDVDKLDSHYEKLEVTQSEFFTNMLRYRDFSVNWALSQLDKKPDPSLWSTTPDVVNAFYNWNFNHIIVTAGILQPPFYSPDYSDALMYGTIGTILGHELTHGFDNKGRLFDKHGHLSHQWSPVAEQGFSNASRCLVDQYSSYSLHGHQSDGNKTLGENIADNGGLKLAYRAFRARGQPSASSLPGLNYTDSQLFYLGFSQFSTAPNLKKYNNAPSLPPPRTHPSTHRVKGCLSNSPEFVSAFSCPSGSPLNPHSKCQVW
ncbi:hypothetical protein EGW08_003803 [Elysia chlorotica]|uniref:Endothelin-converting enzyme 1 n=1 Tax=Elysia chlorotica TaxID=188477 RepID=A0A3S1BHH3_ELYCH|nr:hypothetical protein EGW08_003803 [Elysia chlorotica]